jgi:hypothetical protein
LRTVVGARFTVGLPAGTYAAEWHNVATRSTAAAEAVVVRVSTAREFVPPFADAPAVLYRTTTQIQLTLAAAAAVAPRLRSPSLAPKPSLAIGRIA